jgi:glycerol-3-phosphate acyltransferase PlsY
VTRYASVASMAAAVSLPLFALLFDASWPVLAFTAGGAVAIVLLHRANIARLLHGQEHKMQLRRPRHVSPSGPVG